MSPKIPLRVKSTIPLQLQGSSIEGAGRGVFAGGDVAAGGLIFRIPNPLLNIVDNGDTCDNCLAVTHENLSTVPLKSRTLHACTKCMFLNYCSKECQAQAWIHHHKYECSTLAKQNAKLPAGPLPMADSRDMRLMIRLLSIQASGALSEDEWTEFTTLKTMSEERDEHDLRPNHQQLLQYHSKSLQQGTKTKLSQMEILKILDSVTINAIAIAMPLLNPKQAAEVECTHTVGTCIDPFVAMINHSCDPNAWWTFESKEVRIRARQPIFAGEELTISYKGSEEDFEKRRALVKQHWGFTCTCVLCQKGNLGPTGTLRTRVMSVINTPMLTPGNTNAAMNKEMQKLELLISDLADAGFKPDHWALREVSTMVSAYYFQLNKDSKKMKACLREVISYPALEPWGQILELMWLNQMIDIFRRGGDWATLDIPKVVERRLEKIHWHFKRNYVGEVAKWLGEDSMVAKAAKGDFKEKAGAPSWEKLDGEKEMFMTNLNALMEWANVSE